MHKQYVLDTNILIQQPNSIFGFADNDVIITGTTLQELDHKKTAPGEVGYNTREAIRIIDSFRDKGNYLEGIKMHNGGKFVIDPDGIFQENLPQGYLLDMADNRIISSVLTRMKHYEEPVILITNDVSMRINAIVCGVEVQGYKNEEIQEDEKYTGRATFYLKDKEIDKLYKEGKIELPKRFEEIYDTVDLSQEEKKENVYVENEFLIVKSDQNPAQKTALGFYRNNKVHLIREEKLHAFGVTARNAAQKFALSALLAPPDKIPLVIMKGPAGCAKTFLSLAAGLEGTYDSKSESIYHKVMITRNNILSDADLGFLPGTLEEKMNPLIAPFMDNLEMLLRGKCKEEDSHEIQMQMDDMITSGILEICSMAYMRGRSISNSFLIIDEAQNATVGQILEIITRAGHGTKIVICGDPDQIDNAKLDRINNGLVFAAEKMKGSSLCAQITFQNEESVRSPLALEAAQKLTL